MNRLLLSLLLPIFFMLSACQKENPQAKIEETAIHFCEAFYNFNYPVAKEWTTPTSLSYLSYLASNIRQHHLDRLRKQGPAEVSILSSEIELDAEKATVICQIKHAYLVNPLSGKEQQISLLQDTLRMVKEGGKWLIKKDIPQQNGMQSRD